MKKKKYFIYILECSNSNFYIGYTCDIARRYKEHVLGSAKCKYTRSFPPKSLSQYWTFYCTISEVLRLENALKRLSKRSKKHLIQNPDSISKIIQDSCLEKIIFKLDSEPKL